MKDNKNVKSFGQFNENLNISDVLCVVYIVLDCEAPPKDVIWSVNSTMEKAIESEKQLNEMRVGGALTKIIEEPVD